MSEQEQTILEQVNEYIKGNDLQEAVRIALLHTSQHPEDALGQHAMAVALVRAGRNHDALGFARQAKQLEPKNPVFVNGLGLILRLVQMPEESIEVLSRLLNENPNYAEAWNNLGLSFSNLQHYKKAEQAFEKALAVEDSFAEAWNNLGSMRFGQGRLQEALACFERAIAVRPDYADAWLNRGEVLSRNQEAPAEALKAFRKAVELRPSHLESWYRLCYFLLLCGQFHQVLEIGAQILEVSPDHIDTLQNMAAAADRLQEHQRATVFLRQILVNKPDHAPSLLALAKKALMLGAPVEALSLAELAKGLAPHEGAIYHLIGQIQVRMRRLQEGVTAFGTANRLSPNNPHIQHALSEALLLSGHYQQGLRTYEARLQSTKEPLLFDTAELRGRLWKPDQETEGRRLLLVSEGNISHDLINLRFITALRERWPDFSEIMLFTRDEMVDFLVNEFVIDQIFSPENPPRPGQYDLFLPLGSLPLRLELTYDQLPNYSPVFPVEKEPVTLDLPHSDEFILRVGVCVQQEQEAHSNKNLFKTLTLGMLTSWFELSSIGFYLLHSNFDEQDKMVEGALSRQYPNVISIPEFQESVTDQTRLVKALDLIITVDNRFVTLAAGQEVRAWTLLDYVPDWHWGGPDFNRQSASPWFPNHQAVRQKVIGDWSLPIRDVRRNLAGLLEGETPEA